MKDRMLHALKHYFGYDNFRLEQEHIIQSVLAGKDVLAIMPTGGGKSICYQLPALILDGVTVVISPLIALMKDQVDALQANGIGAAFINSSQSAEQQQQIMQQARTGKLKLLYLAPERLSGSNGQYFFQFLKEIKPALFAVDEAHCISSWGHDFRPEYLQLAVLKREFKGVPVIALTASADKLTQDDILQKLTLQQPQVFISSFNRPNIYYYIEPKRNAFGSIVEYLKRHKEDSGIIYALSRASTEGIAARLRENGIAAMHYHAGMDNMERSKVQERFQRDEIKVIVATIAFGMGIDKSNVRFVIHHDVPKNIEGYYQETGRAGRDGLRSDAILFYSAGDIIKLRKFIEIENNPQQTKVSEKKLQQMQDFCEAESCRRQYLMRYFGEDAPAYCGSCDYCMSDLEEKDATLDAQKLLSAISRTGERYGAGYVIDFIRGSAAEKINPAHKELKTYGLGKHLKKEEWQWMVKQLLNHGYLSKTDDTFSVLKLNDKSWEILKGSLEMKLVMKKEKAQVIDEEDVSYEKELLQELRTIRLEYADREQVPAYVIVADNALIELASYLPQTFDDLKQISGFGDYKVSKYGTGFLNVIKAYTREHKLESQMHFKKPKKQGKERAPRAEKTEPSNTQHTTFSLFREGLSIQEIAEKRNMAISTIEGHLSVFIASGELSISKFVAKEKLEKIMSAIKQTGQMNAIKPIKDLLPEDVTYGEVKMAMEHYKRMQLS